MPDAAVSSSDGGPSPKGGRVSQDDLEKQVAALGGPSGRPRLRVGRQQVVFVAIVAIAFWLIFVFGSTLQQLNEATAREAQVQAETAALQQRLADDQREKELVQSDAYLQLQARGYGLGAPGEQVFSLESGAPSPAPLAQLGAPPATEAPQKPLDAWLNLLFGN
jgi:cell division protein FtsB